ncbi:MAG: class I SAM-dependent methyltransferase [Candidatus Omnitrophota bacterium]|nr:class I SAM-dependent methyltransferase [Candidatus Omnitrophota bacterium]
MVSRDREFINLLFTEKYYKIYNLHILYILNLLFFILHNLKIVNYLEFDFISAEDLMVHFNFHIQSKYSIVWMINFLEEMGYLESKEQNDTAYFRIKKDIPYDGNYDELAKQILELDKNWYPSIELMKNIALEYEFFLKGKKNALEILFKGENANLWNEYFNNTFSGYAVFNIFGAYGVSKWFLETNGKKFLELGGGTAGATVKLFELFKEKNLMDKIEEYIFSDISPIFLRIGNKLIMEKFPDFDRVTLKKIDFNKSLCEQKNEVESIDVVYAVNALHVSQDLLFSLKEIYSILKKRGVLIISELVRPTERYALSQEFIFNLLENYYNVKLDTYLRPSHGFLTPACWKKNFEAAGFNNIEFITNTKSNFEGFPLNATAPVFALIMKGQKG